MPASLSLRTFTVVGVGTPARVTTGDLPRQPDQLLGLQHPVVQDQPVALAGQREDPPAVPLVQVDRPDQQVVAVRWATISMPRLIMSGNCRFSSSSANMLCRATARPPDDDADDLLEPDAQRPGRAVGHEAELGDGLQHPVPGLRRGGCAAR